MSAMQAKVDRVIGWIGLFTCAALVAWVLQLASKMTPSNTHVLVFTASALVVTGALGVGFFVARLMR